LINLIKTILDLLPLKTRRQTLGQLLSLLGILDNKSVQKPGATNLKLGRFRALADLDKLGVLTACLLEEVTDVGDLLRHDRLTEKRGLWYGMNNHKLSDIWLRRNSPRKRLSNQTNRTPGN